jgi:hypothetical protein
VYSGVHPIHAWPSVLGATLMLRFWYSLTSVLLGRAMGRQSPVLDRADHAARRAEEVALAEHLALDLAGLARAGAPG